MSTGVSWDLHTCLPVATEVANPSSLVFLKCMHAVMWVFNLSYPVESAAQKQTCFLKCIECVLECMHVQP